MSMTVVVLGMHRSGTSCLMHALHRAGLHLGLDVTDEVSPGNLEGHWEAEEAVAINNRILEMSGGSWFNVPRSLSCDQPTESLMRGFLDRLCVHPVVGWKDPRTTLTLPFWKPLLSNYFLVACLRHPDSVARSLHARDGMSVELGLQNWAIYNQHLLQVTADEPNVFWVDYDAPADAREQTLAALCGRLELSCDESVLRVFNPYLHHHTHLAPPVDPDIRSLYEQLRERVQVQTATLQQTQKPHSLQVNQVEELSRQIIHLGRVVTLQNQLLQEQRREHDRLARDVQTMNSVLSALVRPAEDAYEFVCRVRQSLPFRLARTMGRVAGLMKRVFVRTPEKSSCPPDSVRDQERKAA